MRGVVLCAAVLIGVGGLSTDVQAGPPTDRVLEYTRAVIKVLDDPVLQQPDRRRDRRAAVRRIAAEIFDLEETARRALGRHWQVRTPEEREQFVKAFADLLERTYIAKIDLYGGERVRVTGEKLEGDRAAVRGQVISRGGIEIPVEARLHRKAGQWYIYDVSVENISLVANYRAQFDRIIRTGSYAELMRRMRDLNESLDRKDLTSRRPES
jgi:phospholipid transport system substrate-binding protein